MLGEPFTFQLRVSKFSQYSDLRGTTELLVKKISASKARTLSTSIAAFRSSTSVLMAAMRAFSSALTSSIRAFYSIVMASSIKSVTSSVVIKSSESIWLPSAYSAALARLVSTKIALFLSKISLDIASLR